MIDERMARIQRQKIERLTETIAELTSENASLSKENNLLKKQIENKSKECDEAIGRLSAIEQEYGSAILEANEIRNKYQTLIDRAMFEMKLYEKKFAKMVAKR